MLEGAVIEAVTKISERELSLKELSAEKESAVSEMAALNTKA